MALGILSIIFIVLGIGVLVSQFLLYKNNSNGIFILNVALGILISYLIFSSLPSNFMTQKYIALIWGALAILAMIVKSVNMKNIMVSKIMLSVSLFGGILHLLFF